MADTPTGRFVWYELMTTDPKAAESFYGDLAGWSSAPFEGSSVPYDLLMNGEAPVGGVMTLPEEARKAGAPPHWIAYVTVSDVDATVKKAKKLGATPLHGPQDVPEVGRWAVLRDPQGAVFAVFTPVNETQPYAPPKQGEFSWNELMTSSYADAFEFYNALFGWEKTEAMEFGEGEIYQMYGQEGKTYGGMFNKPDEVPAPPHWLFYIMVDDVDKRAEEVKARGGQILNGPMEVPGGDRIVQCMDPQGAAFALHSTKK